MQHHQNLQSKAGFSIHYLLVYSAVVLESGLDLQATFKEFLSCLCGVFTGSGLG